MKDYYFSEEHKMFRKSLRDFLDKEVMPNIDQWEEDRRVPKDFWKKFGEMGYFGLNMPEEYGEKYDSSFYFSIDQFRIDSLDKSSLPMFEFPGTFHSGTLRALFSCHRNTT